MARLPDVPKEGFYIYTSPQGWSQYYLDGIKLLSVSKVKEAIGTGEGLQWWAANMERGAMLRAARAAYAGAVREAREAVTRGGTIEAMPDDIAWVTRLENALPRELAYESYRDEQADIGKEVHALLEEWYRRTLAGEARTHMADNLSPDLPNREAVRNAFRAAMTFIEEREITPLAAERPVYSRELGVGGRLDKVVLVRGYPAVLDWKATKSVHYTARVTTAAYRMLYNDCPEKLVGVPRIDRALIVQLPKIAGAPVLLHPMDPGDCDDLNDVFRHAAHVRRALDREGIFDRARR